MIRLDSSNGRTLEACVFIRHVASACHILHSPQVYTAIAAATGNALAVFTSCAACNLATCNPLHTSSTERRCPYGQQLVQYFDCGSTWASCIWGHARPWLRPDNRSCLLLIGTAKCKVCLLVLSGIASSWKARRTTCTNAITTLS